MNNCVDSQAADWMGNPIQIFFSLKVHLLFYFLLTWFSLFFVWRSISFFLTLCHKQKSTNQPTNPGSWLLRKIASKSVKCCNKGLNLQGNRKRAKEGVLDALNKIFRSERVFYLQLNCRQNFHHIKSTTCRNYIKHFYINS